MRDFTKLVSSPVFGITSAERAVRECGEHDQEAAALGGGGLMLRDYQLEVMCSKGKLVVVILWLVTHL